MTEVKHFADENYKPENYRYVGRVNVPARMRAKS